jgi:hypothetical protein
VERKKGSGKSALTGRRLRELAVEATKHLDEVLPEGAGEAGSAKGAPASSKGDSGSVKAASASSKGDSGSAKAASASPKGRSGPAKAASASARGDSRPAAVHTARALVAHVSPGACRILANLLNHIGLEAKVADAGSNLRETLESEEWDIVFAQGTSMPYPGRRISLAALSHCSGLGTPVILLSRRGESLIPEAAGGNAVGLLEWPFSAEKVLRALTEAIPDHRFV